MVRLFRHPIRRGCWSVFCVSISTSRQVGVVFDNSNDFVRLLRLERPTRRKDRTAWGISLAFTSPSLRVARRSSVRSQNRGSPAVHSPVYINELCPLIPNLSSRTHWSDLTLLTDYKRTRSQSLTVFCHLPHVRLKRSHARTSHALGMVRVFPLSVAALVAGSLPLSPAWCIPRRLRGQKARAQTWGGAAGGGLH